MNNIVKTTIATLLFSMAALSSFAQAAKYKCMIQMNAYEGEKAYVVISLINPSGAYEKNTRRIGI